MLPSAACGVAPANADPVISATASSVTSGAAPLAVTFTATATDADGDALTYTWDLDGNGTFETTGQNPTFTYTTAGTYTAVVKVTDAKGGSTTKTLHASPCRRGRATGPTCRSRRRQRAERARR